MQAFAADAFRGRTVRLRAWIRVEKTEAADHSQMWLRVDRPERQVGLPPAPEGSGDAVLSAAGMPLFFLDISAVPADSSLGRWLAESHLHYNVGAVWQTADAEANLSPERLSREYDGLIFVEEGHAARGLQGQK